MKYFIKKLFTLIMTLLFISMLTFGAFSVISGDAAVTKLARRHRLSKLKRSARRWDLISRSLNVMSTGLGGRRQRRFR